jgi:hypothetical protein
MKSSITEFKIKKIDKLLHVSKILKKDLSSLWKRHGGPSRYFKIAQFENDGIDDFSDLPYGNLIYKTDLIFVFNQGTEYTLVELSGDLKSGCVYSIDDFYFEVMVNELNNFLDLFITEKN